ncbi:MAG: AIM24 family protein [Nocardioidaceae bacterium]|nr:AIM24 family protein [Nocardioidaceae bacterium]MCL2613899.1 AIM24 family protein [Nocardioidaceae bacterium]
MTTAPTTPTSGDTYTCRYCRLQSQLGQDQRSCPTCGAPIDLRAAVSTSGWVEQPPIADMTRIQFGRSRVQIEGDVVPVADFSLHEGESVYFSHHALLWAEPGVRITNHPNAKGWKRMLAGMPSYMLDATGPGRVGISDNHAGEVIAVPLPAGGAMWVREHRFLAATTSIDYTYARNGLWYRTGYGDDRETHYPLGMYDDVFTARSEPGLLLLHAPGNTFVRDLAPGEHILVQPRALLYKDLSVQMGLHLEAPSMAGWSTWRRFQVRTMFLRLVGPGRVAVHSVFENELEGEAVTGGQYTTQQW